MHRVASRAAWTASGLSVMMTAGIGRAVAETGQPAAQIAAICASCHRFDNRPNGMPPIVTLGEGQIIAMMRSFKARPRSSPTMHVVGQGLSDAEIVAVAGYLSKLDGKAIR